VALPPGHAARLAAAEALMQMDRPQDEYWLAVMLARVAEWEAGCPEGTGSAAVLR